MWSSKWGDIFSTTFYGLYFIHHKLHTLQFTILNVPLCAAVHILLCTPVPWHVDAHIVVFFFFFFFCWLAAWRQSYRGKPWRLNHFIVLTLYQNQHKGTIFTKLYLSTTDLPLIYAVWLTSITSSKTFDILIVKAIVVFLCCVSVSSRHIQYLQNMNSCPHRRSSMICNV